MVRLCTRVAYSQVDFCVAVRVHVYVFVCAVHQHPERERGKNKRRVRPKEIKRQREGWRRAVFKPTKGVREWMHVCILAWSVSHKLAPNYGSLWVWVYTGLTWYCKSGTIKKLPLVSQTLLLLLPLPPFFPAPPAETNQSTVACDSIRVCVCLMPRITSYPVETTEVIHPGYNGISLLHIYTHTHTLFRSMHPAIMEMSTTHLHTLHIYELSATHITGVSNQPTDWSKLCW